MDSTVSFSWLKEHLHTPGMVPVDCRFSLQDPNSGYQGYLEDHIPGAVYLDLEKDLSGPVNQHGGRHPLPDVSVFAARLGSLGITRESKIVAYDDQNGAMAARLWWLMQYLGHQNVAVLNGNYAQWVDNKYPTTAEIPVIDKPTNYLAELQPQLVATMEDVKAGREDDHVVLIDSRERRRFAGIEEPIDKKAGHIPGAINLFWRERLDGAGYWRTLDKLQADFDEIGKDKQIIVYCGSGVTACPNILALRLAGYQNVRLYPGSWSDWITYPENPIGTDK